VQVRIQFPDAAARTQALAALASKVTTVHCSTVGDPTASTLVGSSTANADGVRDILVLAIMCKRDVTIMRSVAPAGAAAPAAAQAPPATAKATGAPGPVARDSKAPWGNRGRGTIDTTGMTGPNAASLGTATTPIITGSSPSAPRLGPGDPHPTPAEWRQIFTARLTPVIENCIGGTTHGNNLAQACTQRFQLHSDAAVTEAITQSTNALAGMFASVVGTPFSSAILGDVHDWLVHHLATSPNANISDVITSRILLAKACAVIFNKPIWLLDVISNEIPSLLGIVKGANTSITNHPLVTAVLPDGDYLVACNGIADPAYAASLADRAYAAGTPMAFASACLRQYLTDMNVPQPARDAINMRDTQASADGQMPTIHTIGSFSVHNLHASFKAAFKGPAAREAAQAAAAQRAAAAAAAAAAKASAAAGAQPQAAVLALHQQLAARDLQLTQLQMELQQLRQQMEEQDRALRASQQRPPPQQRRAAFLAIEGAARGAASAGNEAGGEAAAGVGHRPSGSSVGAKRPRASGGPDDTDSKVPEPPLDSPGMQLVQAAPAPGPGAARTGVDASDGEVNAAGSRA
jgi:hypothetical protein